MSIHVAVGVIINEQEQVLIAQRPSDKHLGGKWEFPGGKVEDNENSQQALHRELLEELGIKIISVTHLIDITHEYHDDEHGSKQVFLDVYEVRSWQGVPSGREGQATRWIEKQELPAQDFPAANAKIISKLI